MTNEALDVKEVAEKMKAVCKRLGWETDIKYSPKTGQSHKIESAA